MLPGDPTKGMPRATRGWKVGRKAALEGDRRRPKGIPNPTKGRSKPTTFEKARCGRLAGKVAPVNAESKVGSDAVSEGIKLEGIFGGFSIKLVCFFSVSLVLFTKVSALKFWVRTPVLHQSCTKVAPFLHRVASATAKRSSVDTEQQRRGCSWGSGAVNPLDPLEILIQMHA